MLKNLDGHGARYMIWIIRIAAVLIVLLTGYLAAALPAAAENDTAEKIAADDAAEENSHGAVVNRFEHPDAFPEAEPDPDAKLLEIWSPPIANSDCFILKYGDQVWMIDCSDHQWSRYAAQLLDELGIERVDRILGSHPHHDHLNGITRIAKVADIGEFMLCFPLETNEHTVALGNFCKENDIPITYFKDGDEMSMGDGVSFRIWQKGDKDWDMNNRSAVMKLTYGIRSMLFTGDILQKAQQRLTETVGVEELKSDILKYPHHGREAMDDEFFKAVSPELVIIPSDPGAASRGGKYLKSKGVDALYTVVPCIHLMTDGKIWIAEKMEFKPNPGFQSGMFVPFLKNYNNPPRKSKPKG